MVVLVIEEIDGDLTDFAVDVVFVAEHLRGVVGWTWHDASHLDGTAVESIACQEEVRQG